MELGDGLSKQSGAQVEGHGSLEHLTRRGWIHLDGTAAALVGAIEEVEVHGSANSRDFVGNSVDVVGFALHDDILQNLATSVV